MHGSVVTEISVRRRRRRPHFGRATLLAAALSVLLFACAPTTPSAEEEQPAQAVEVRQLESPAGTLEPAAAESMTLSGTVRYLDLEGGVYVIASEGTNYNPIDGLPEEFRVDGIEVEADVRQRDDVAGIGMVGPMVELLDIRRSESADTEGGAGPDGPDQAADQAAADDETGTAEAEELEAGDAGAGEGVSAAESEAATTEAETASTDAAAAALAADERPEPGGDSELWDSSWRLVDLGGRRAMGQVAATLEFPAEGGRAVGNASCNRFFGGVAVDGDSITFLDVGTMRMTCPAAINDQEQRFLAALESAERYEVEEQELRIFGADAEAPIRFSRIVEQQG